jgi:acyl-CoA reductase-like NAD-dependent aldehyde dehydrogenase
MSNIPHAPVYIDNKPLPQSKESTHQVLHPQTQDVVSTYTSASSDDVRAALSSCASALRSWEDTAPSQRRAVLIKAADLLVSDQHHYKKLILEYTMKETGAVTGWATFTGAMGAATTLREAASLATQIKGETIQSETPGATFMVLRKACGVVSSHPSQR